MLGAPAAKRGSRHGRGRRDSASPDQRSIICWRIRRTRWLWSPRRVCRNRPRLQVARGRKSRGECARNGPTIVAERRRPGWLHQLRSEEPACLVERRCSHEDQGRSIGVLKLATSPKDITSFEGSSLHLRALPAARHFLEARGEVEPARPQPLRAARAHASRPYTGRVGLGKGLDLLVSIPRRTATKKIPQRAADPSRATVQKLA
jgi:hypothetical protein